jgi:hypothetical protein
VPTSTSQSIQVIRILRKAMANFYEETAKGRVLRRQCDKRMQITRDGAMQLVKIPGESIKEDDQNHQVDQYGRVHFSPCIQEGWQFVDILFVAGKHTLR